jgi:hypothetical protein
MAQLTAQQSTVLEKMRYDTVAKNSPLTTISAVDLQAALALNKTIAAYPKSPLRLMQVVATALEANSDIELDRLRWVLSPDGNLNDDHQLLTSSTVVSSALATGAEPSALIEVGFVTAEIAAFSGDYRRALNSVNRFVSRLKANQSVASVDILQGSTNDEQTKQTQPALFKLKIILKAAMSSTRSTAGAQGFNPP